MATTRGGGGVAVYTTGWSLELHIANPKKYVSLTFCTQKNTWHQNFLPKKIQGLKTSILTYSIKQTLRSQKKLIRDRSLDLKKNTEGVNFQSKKTHRTPRHLYWEYLPPWGLGLG